MIDFSEPPKLWIPERPAIIRPGINLSKYFPVEIDQSTRQAIVSELVKRKVDDNRSEVIKQIEAAIPFGMFKPASIIVPTTIGISSIVFLSSGTANLTYPSGITSGDTLVIIAAAAAASGDQTLNTPSTFTSLNAQLTDGGDIRASYVFHKTATGSESGTLSINTTSRAGSGSAVMFVFRNATNIYAANATGNAANPNPPLLNPSIGIVGFRWISWLMSSSTGAVSGYPTGYSDNQTTANDGTRLVAFATKSTTNVSSDDPSQFTKASAGFHVRTIALAKV
jgi:hypothetical protein